MILSSLKEQQPSTDVGFNADMPTANIMWKQKSYWLHAFIITMSTIVLHTCKKQSGKKTWISIKGQYL